MVLFIFEYVLLCMYVLITAVVSHDCVYEYTFVRVL